MNTKYPMAKGQEKHILPISMYRRVGDTVYLAGNGAVDEDGNFVGDTLEAQMRYTLREVEKTLAEIGLTFADLVMVRAYVQNLADLPRYN